MVSIQDKYDSTFLGILQNEGKIPPFLDAIFSFLYRRTDFFRLMKSPEDKMGFPPGVASKLVNDVLKKYETLARRDDKERERRQKQLEDRLHPTQNVTDLENVCPVIREEEVESSKVIHKSEKILPQPQVTANQNCVQEGKDYQAKIPKTTDKNTNETLGSSANKKVSSDDPYVDPNTAPKSVKLENVVDTSEAGTKPKLKEDNSDGEDPELTKLQKIYQANPESYNGAVRDNYSWSQSITDVDVRINVPTHIKRGKDVKVIIKRKHVSASCKSTNGEMEEIINGDLAWDINQEESIWTLVPGEHIHVNLEKVQERWWDALLTNEPKISVRKIDPSRPMTDLDDEAQSKIHEMMYNEQRKRMGLPQSHEMKMNDMLKNAWDAEGSPFKGQPFDPSKLNISAPGAMNMP